MKLLTHLTYGVCWVFLPLAGFGSRPTQADPPASAERPNIVLIVADDLGYGELGCQGNKEIPTPNIDSLAANGVRFTSGYVSCPVCSPTRAGLLTGRYQQRFGHEFNPGPPGQADADFGLPLTEVTIADRLKTAGYVTGMVGKWHLGLKEPFHPLKRGFDEYFGFLHGAHPYLDPNADPLNLILRGTQVVEKEEYLTDAFSREAVGFIVRNRTKPFFLYLPYNAVHGPLEATEKYLERFAHISDGRRRTFAAMLSAMDDGVGAVLKQLRDSGLERNTLIFFISDNGGPTPTTTSGNGPLRGYKGNVWEGGIRVPFMVQWKKELAGGQVDDRPVIALDILPTALAAAGGKLPEDAALDGVNLLPFLTREKKAAVHQRLYWRFGHQRALRQDRYKLVVIGDEAPRLFDLADDIGEARDLSKEKPDLVRSLSEAYAAWDKQLVPPRWGQPRLAPAESGTRQRRKSNH